MQVSVKVNHRPKPTLLTISGAFTNGVTIMPIPAKFQTALGSLETDGVVIDPPPSGASDLTISKTHNPDIAIPGGTVTYTVTVSNVGSGPSSGAVTVTETPPPGLTVTALSGTGWTCTVATRTCTRSDALAPGASYPPITVTTSVAAGAASGVVTNTAVVVRRRRLELDQQHGDRSDDHRRSGSGDGPDHHEEAQPADRRTRADVFVLHCRVERGELGVERRGNGDRNAAGGLDGDGALWRRLDLHRRDTDLHSKRRARPGDELPGHHGDDECRRRRGAWYGDEHRGRLRRRRPEQRQQHGDGSDGHHLASRGTRPHASEDAERGRRRAGADNHVHHQGDERRRRGRRAATITVTETPPPNLTVTALSGSGWTCVVATRTCLRADALPPTASYPEITVTAVVASNAAGTVVNGAVVTGGGDTDPGNGSVTSPIEVGPAATGSDLTLAKTRTEGGVLTPGQPVTFTLRVTNVGGSPTSGTVTVTENPPAGLTVTAISGSGWTCSVATRTCTRADALAPSASYPDISVTASIAAGAVGTLVNSAVVSGGGDSSTGNNTATSPITVSPLPVPTLPVWFVIALLSALLAIALVALRARRLASFTVRSR